MMSNALSQLTELLRLLSATAVGLDPFTQHPNPVPELKPEP
jgi:hypothetical protein